VKGRDDRSVAPRARFAERDRAQSLVSAAIGPRWRKVVRRMAFASALCLLLGGPALGAAGDVLMVTGTSVNVRSGPGTDHRVDRQVGRGQRVIEIERSGGWVRVGIEGGADGWIHGSLLTPEEPAATAALPPGDKRSEEGGPAAPSQATPGESAAAPAVEIAPAPGLIAPAATSEIDPADLQRFRDSVDYLNSRALAVAGADLFTGVEPLGGGAVQVGATEAWASMPPAGQRSYANTLLDRWAAALGRAGPVKVQIVDASGQVLMEESKP
jgi:hypothetical protein